MSAVRAVADNGEAPPPTSDREVIEAAVVALRRCEATELPEYVKRPLRRFSQLLEREVAR